MLAPKKMRSRQTRTRDPERTVGVLVERIVRAGESIPFDFHWTGGGPSSRTDVPRGLLPGAVYAKIDQQYTKPASGRFWLLAHSVDSLLSKDNPDIAESRRLLATSPHPFDEIRFLYPYAENELGALLHVWPTQRNG